MRHLLRNALLIVFVLLLMSAAVYPPKEKLRLGKDLAGGVSLIYSVQLNPDDPPSVVDRVIEVLTERVNPDGLFEISFVRQGRDRIEVTMPLPSKEVQELKTQFDAALAEFRVFDLDTAGVERALRASGDERRAQLEALMDTDAKRAMLEPVVEALATAEQARTVYEAARANVGADDESLADLLNAAAEAEIALDEARLAALSSATSPEDVRQALARPDDKPIILDEAGNPVSLPSPRERAIEAIQEKIGDLPGGAQAIDNALAALETYNANRKGLDDPEDLQRLLQGAGVLRYRIAIKPGELPDEQALRRDLRERGPANVQSDNSVWVALNKLDDWFDRLSEYDALIADPPGFFRGRNMVVEEYDGEYYALMHDSSGKRLTAAEGEWALQESYRTQDQLGRTAVGFNMDSRGARLMGEFTGPNVGEPMGVILDGRLYTVARINQRLTRNSQISGTFSESEVSYLIKTLNAGSLQARLSEDPISISNLAPELGADNLEKGLRAAWISLIAVGAFMIIYYFNCGIVAMIALLANAIIILGAMSLARAAFTLPGIAGIVLTFGMAVDANVLIYERLREELKAGNDLRSAIRIAYSKVLSTIVDANVTNLIVCVVLAQTATQEIRGFAITLGIGVVATMFSSLLITRVVFALLIDKVKIRSLSQLPIAIPVIDRLLTPKIDWVGLRWVFLFISLGLVGTGVGFIAVQGSEMLDTEFRGGTAIDLRLSEADPDAPITFAEETYDGNLTRAQVESVISEIASEAEAELAGLGVSSSSEGDSTERSMSMPLEDGSVVETTVTTPAESLDPLERRRADLRMLSELKNAGVVAINPQTDGTTSSWFKIKTTITDQELLLDAVVSRFAPIIDSKPPLEFVGSSVENIDDAPVFPIIDDTLGANIGRDDVRNSVAEFAGGAIVLLENISPNVTEADLRDRIDYIRSQGSYISVTAPRAMDLIVIDAEGDAVRTAAIVVSDPRVNALYDTEKWKLDLAESEWQIAREGLAVATTLAGVQSFSPEIAATFRGKAIVSVILSFMLITIYIWVRFGSIRFSLAAIAPLIHDVITAIGLIALAEILYDHFPGAAAVGIQPFKIDLGLVAAILTIIGYSLNDTIVILDRIRENRGKLAYASKEVVNRSINETISRSVITSGTTLMALIVMFVIGGEGIASFTYALICGIIVGTYSSIAVAAPLVWTRKIPKAAEPFRRHAQAEAEHSTALSDREPIGT